MPRKELPAFIIAPVLQPPSVKRTVDPDMDSVVPGSYRKGQKEDAIRLAKKLSTLSPDRAVFVWYPLNGEWVQVKDH